MCVLAMAWKVHPHWRLIVAANRDERHDRPGEPLAPWPDAGVIAGRDVAAGGTWLGVSEGGRFAAVTNLRGFGDADPGRLSRGTLVRDLLTRSPTAPSPAALEQFNPFNAVLVEATGAAFLTNRPDAVVRPLLPGFHALSNGPLDPPWRKTMRLAEEMREWLADPERAIERLFAALRDPEPPGDTDDDPAAIFVLDPVYGTRCSTLVLVDHSGAGVILERRYDALGRAVGETKVAFEWP